MIIRFENKTPDIDGTAFIAENAVVIGDVTLKKDTSVFYNAVLRGDTENISVGEGTNIQDSVVIHASHGLPVTIGKNVTIGHRALVHGCTLEDNILVGMGAIILDGAHIGHDSLIGAGTLIKENTEIPPCSLVVGSPCRIARTLTEEQIQKIRGIGPSYVSLSRRYLENAENLLNQTVSGKSVSEPAALSETLSETSASEDTNGH